MALSGIALLKKLLLAAVVVLAAAAAANADLALRGSPVGRGPPACGLVAGNWTKFVSMEAGRQFKPQALFAFGASQPCPPPRAPSPGPVLGRDEAGCGAHPKGEPCPSAPQPVCVWFGGPAWRQATNLCFACRNGGALFVTGDAALSGCTSPGRG